ncbi:hypothetical protein Q2941_26040 [Bradyrhizobium sp. UFLA05-153]
MRPVRVENRTPSGQRPIKINFGEMRQVGVRGVLVYCADYRCTHSTLSADRWQVPSGPEWIHEIG